MIMGALKDMELTEPINVAENDGGHLDGGVNMDDLLGEDLMEMEQDTITNVMQDARTARKGKTVKAKRATSNRSSHKKNAPLGILNKKFEFLLRGSPRQRSVTPSAVPPYEGDGKSRNATKKERVGSSKTDGSMSSKNSSKHYL